MKGQLKYIQPVVDKLNTLGDIYLKYVKCARLVREIWTVSNESG